MVCPFQVYFFYRPILSELKKAKNIVKSLFVFRRWAVVQALFLTVRKKELGEVRGPLDPVPWGFVAVFARKFDRKNFASGSEGEYQQWPGI